MVELLLPYVTDVIELIVIILITFIGIKINQWVKNSTVGQKVETFVLAAEKLKETGAIGDKPSYVESMLNAAGIKVTPEIRAMIEAAVKRIDLKITSDAIDKDLK